MEGIYVFFSLIFWWQGLLGTIAFAWAAGSSSGLISMIENGTYTMMSAAWHFKVIMSSYSRSGFSMFSFFLRFEKRKHRVGIVKYECYISYIYIYFQYMYRYISSMYTHIYIYICIHTFSASSCRHGFWAPKATVLKPRFVNKIRVRNFSFFFCDLTFVPFLFGRKIEFQLPFPYFFH